MQENQIKNNIQDLKQRFNQLLHNRFDQFTQQGGGGQLVPVPSEQVGEALGNALIRISETASLDFKENKTPSEYFRGALKGDFRRKKWDDMLFFWESVGRYQF